MSLQAQSRAGDRALLGARVAQMICEHIAANRLSDGDPLPSEAELAEEYRVSQRVVRDALRSLAQQGVLRTQQGKRAVVSELRPVAVHGFFRLAMQSDAAAMDQLLELRSTLESSAASLAAARITEPELARLRQLLDETGQSDLDLDLDRRTRLDLDFHQVLVGATHNKFFSAVLEALADVLAEERRHGKAMTEAAGGTHEESDREHRALLAAVEEGDAALAESLMRAHLRRVQRAFQAQHG